MDRLTPKWNLSGKPGQEADTARDNPAKQRKKRPAPFSLRLSFEEKQQLIEDAGRQSISAYIKSRLFDPDVPVKQARGLNPVKDQKALAQVLGMLGASNIAAHLNELAEAARVGALPAGEETEHAIRRACDDIRIMRGFLLAALGIRETDTSTQICESCASSFNRASIEYADNTPEERQWEDITP